MLQVVFPIPVSLAGCCSQCVVSGLCRAWAEEGASLKQWVLAVLQLSEESVTVSAGSWQRPPCGTGGPWRGRWPWWQLQVPAHQAGNGPSGAGQAALGTLCCPPAWPGSRPSAGVPLCPQSRSKQRVPVPELPALCGAVSRAGTWCGWEPTQRCLGTRSLRVWAILAFFRHFKNCGKNNAEVDLVRV